MNIKQQFLTLSIRHQITLSIIVLTLTCLLLCLSVLSLYANIMTNILALKRKEYFYQKYQDIVESEIKFQSMLLYQHEHLIKGFNSQIYYYGLSQDDLYDTKIKYEKDLIKTYEETTEMDYENSKDNFVYYIKYFSDNAYMDSKVFNLLASTHSSVDNQLNILRNFRVPYLGESFKIVNDYVFVRLREQSLYSTNRTRIKEIEDISSGNFSKYYDDLVDFYSQKYRNFMNEFKKGELPFMDIFFPDKYDLFLNYVNETYLNINFKNNIKKYLDGISSNFHFIDYVTEKTFITDNGDKKNGIFLGQNSILPDYINIFFSKYHNASDINVIPVFSTNNTIMSVSLCYAFLYKQMIFLNLTEEKNIFGEEKLNEIYNKLKKGVSNIGDCILDKKYNFDTKQNAFEILNIKFDKLYSIKNSREISLVKLSDSILGNSLICIKYTFPDYISLFDFKPTFFTLDQLNLYCFKIFYEPKHYEDDMETFFLNCQFFMIMLLILLWVAISFYLVFRIKKLFKEVIDPINNLINVINKLEVNEENMLKYESDDTINELFQLCNNLLLGKYKQKNIHDSELDKNEGKNENNGNMNNLNNLKLNIKLVEDMIENKNDFNLKGDEILTFKINDYLSNAKMGYRNNNIQLNNNNEMRKTVIVKRKLGKKNNANYDIINAIQSNIKKTRSINQAINNLNKKYSFDINLMNISDSLIQTENKNDDDAIEIEILINYKHLYDIVDLIYNYDIKYDKKFISKINKLLYKNNMSNYSKNYYKKKSKNKFTSSKNSIEDKNDNNSGIDTKDDSKIKIEEFDKSVILAYEAVDFLFIWYEEAKYFKSVAFLQNNHSKELNNLFNIIPGNENKKPNNQLISEIQRKKTEISKKQAFKFH